MMMIDHNSVTFGRFFPYFHRFIFLVNLSLKSQTLCEYMIQNITQTVTRVLE